MKEQIKKSEPLWVAYIDGEGFVPQTISGSRSATIYEAANFNGDSRVVRVRICPIRKKRKDKK